MTEKPKKTPKEELECPKKYIYDIGIIFECKENSRVEILDEDVVGLLNALHEKNHDNEVVIEFLSTENSQIRDELKTRTQIQHQLEEENGQLKSDNNRLVNETAKIVAEHQGRVLDLIDEKIKEDKRNYKMTYEDELKGRIEVLEELKKELQE